MLPERMNRSISKALSDAQNMERIMVYLVTNSYKVPPEEGILATNLLLGLSSQIVDTLKELKGTCN